LEGNADNAIAHQKYIESPRLHLLPDIGNNGNLLYQTGCSIPCDHVCSYCAVVCYKSCQLGDIPFGSTSESRHRELKEALSSQVASAAFDRVFPPLLRRTSERKLITCTEFVLNALAHSTLTCPFAPHADPAFPYPALSDEAAENAAGIPLVDPDFWHVFVEALTSPITLTAKFGLNPRDSQAAEDRLRNLATPLGPTKSAKPAPFITVGKAKPANSNQHGTPASQPPGPATKQAHTKGGKGHR